MSKIALVRKPYKLPDSHTVESRGANLVDWYLLI